MATNCWKVRFRFPTGAKDFSPPSSFHIASGTHQVSYQVIIGVFSLRVKMQGLEADSSPPSTSEVKNGEVYFSVFAVRVS
jgi:hypothetical protein